MPMFLNSPGASNVISGSVNFTIDVRSAHDSIRTKAVEDIKEKFGALCERRGITCKVMRSSAGTSHLSSPPSPLPSLNV